MTVSSVALDFGVLLARLRTATNLMSRPASLATLFAFAAVKCRSGDKRQTRAFNFEEFDLQCV